MSDSTAEIAKAVIAIMAELESLPKDGHNSFSGYDFTTEAMIANTFRPAMAKHGLALVPFNSEITNSQGEAGKKGDMQRVTISGQYKLIHTSGESLSIVVPGEGMDSLDKSTAKALTQSYKYALLQIFCAGRGEDGDHGKGYVNDSATIPETRKISENVALRRAQEAETNNPDPMAYVLSFGKHKGSSIMSVPVDYLKWLSGKTEEDLLDKAKANFAGKNKQLLDVILFELSRRARNSSEPDPFDAENEF